MMNRNLRTTLPTMEKNIHPQEVNHEEAKFRDEQIMLTIMTGNIQPVLYLDSTLVIKSE